MWPFVGTSGNQPVVVGIRQTLSGPGPWKPYPSFFKHHVITWHVGPAWPWGVFWRTAFRHSCSYFDSLAQLQDYLARVSRWVTPSIVSNIGRRWESCK